MGFLHPVRLPNGYYDYTSEDLAALIYLRKLRQYSFSLSEAENFISDSSTSRLDLFSRKEEEIRNEIDLLQKKLRFIEFEKQHIQESRRTYTQAASLMTSIDEKIDLYPPFHELSSAYRSLIPSYYLETTTCLYVPQDILNGPILNKKIPLKVGIGTYRCILEKENLPIPAEAVRIPHGLQISMVLMLSDLSAINIQKLSPMMKLARAKKMSFLSPTTGYLAAIRENAGKRVYIFRLRACVAKQDRPSEFPL
jgi:DNA-binding transcriptional MerR regulator